MWSIAASNKNIVDANLWDSVKSQRTGMLFAVVTTWLAVYLSFYTGSITLLPNADHYRGALSVIQHGYPTNPALPPLFSYFIALKLVLSNALDIPYWWWKFVIDASVVSITFVLTYHLALCMTGSTLLAKTSAYIQLLAPIYILCVPMDLAEVLFQPVFVLSLILMFQSYGKQSPKIWLFYSGIVMGVASLIRGNTQYIFVVIPLVIAALNRSQKIRNDRVRPVYGTLVFAAGQWIIMLPWIIHVGGHSQAGPMTSDVIYRAYYESFARNPDTEVSKWVADNYELPERTLKGVIDFNIKWINENPLDLCITYCKKIIRAWYISDSGRWDYAIIISHAPIWIMAVSGLIIGLRRNSYKTAIYIMLIVILYMWAVSAMFAGVARYSAALYGFLGVMCGILSIKYYGGNSYDKR